MKRGTLRLLAIAAFAATSARADMSKQECIDANGKGQDLAHDGMLSAARAQLQACAVSACPPLVRDDCVRRLDALDALQPSITFEAKDASGNDLSAVTVTLDGAPFATKLDGRPLPADPGEHVFVFTAAGHRSVTRKLVLVERDQARRERVVLEPDEAAAAPGPTAAGAKQASSTEPTSPQHEPGGMGTRRLVGLVSGGVGIAAVGVGAAFGLMTGAAWSAQKRDCASAASCADHAQAVNDHSTATTDGAIANAAFVAGGALLVAGVVLYVTGGKTTPPATGLVVAPGMAPGGGAFMIRGTF